MSTQTWLLESHFWLVPQALPQRPQLVIVSRGVSQSGLVVSQLPNALAQTGMVHLFPAPHDDVAFAKVQAVPHAPQLLFVLRLVSQPGCALQSPKPSLH